MVIPMEGLPKGYILMSSPDDKTFLLALEIEGEQQLKEIEWFDGDTPPDKETCIKSIENWNCAKIPNK